MEDPFLPTLLIPILFVILNLLFYMHMPLTKVNDRCALIQYRAWFSNPNILWMLIPNILPLMLYKMQEIQLQYISISTIKLFMYILLFLTLDIYQIYILFHYISGSNLNSYLRMSQYSKLTYNLLMMLVEISKIRLYLFLYIMDLMPYMF